MVVHQAVSIEYILSAWSHSWWGLSVRFFDRKSNFQLLDIRMLSPISGYSIFIPDLYNICKIGSRNFKEWIVPYNIGLCTFLDKAVCFFVSKFPHDRNPYLGNLAVFYQFLTGIDIFKLVVKNDTLGLKFLIMVVSAV